MSSTVGYLTKRFPRLSETFILDEILGLEAAGVPLRLYALAHPGEVVIQPDVARVASPIVYLHAPGGWRQRVASLRATVAAHGRLLARSRRRYLGVVAYVAWKRHHLSSVRHFAEAGRLALLLEAEDARHVHAAFAHGPASVAHYVHLLTGLPFSFAAHAKDLYLSAPDLLARKISAAEFVLACSESAASALRALPGADAAKIVLAYHGVDTTRFRPQVAGWGTPPQDDSSTAPLRLLAVGRLVAKKGYPILLDALARARADGHRVELDVIGGGPQLKALEARATDLGLDGYVHFLGARTHQEIAAAYTRADAFVQASIVLADGDRDGIPNSLLEAMASGLPVIATAAGGIPEVVIHGQSGLLAPPGDAASLATLFGVLAADRDLQRQLGRTARVRMVEEFDRGGMIRAISPLFGESAVQRAA